jgi:hypothetical protein
MSLASVSTHTLWELSLGIGVVVLLVVIALMVLLLNIIKGIEAGTEALNSTAGGVEQNTTTIAQFAVTPGVLEEIKAEALVHADFLASKVGSR